uniref:FKB95-like N-terminal Kelch domain-containing protein n=1 Tax=Quercus lobata TaxID=97700 RepID=A0A7N2N075_QUELO
MEEEENGWAMSDLRETEICVLGKYNTDRYVKCYVIKVPDPDACPHPSYFSCPLFKLKEKKKQPSFSPKELNPLKLNKEKKPWPSQYFAVLGNHLYAVGGVIKTRKTDVWILDFSSPHKGCKAGPPMNFRRRDPQMVVVDGKLFVFGGLRFKPKSNSSWMEVFDLLSQTWESLLLEHFNIK